MVVILALMAGVAAAGKRKTGCSQFRKPAVVCDQDSDAHVAVNKNDLQIKKHGQTMSVSLHAGHTFKLNGVPMHEVEVECNNGVWDLVHVEGMTTSITWEATEIRCDSTRNWYSTADKMDLYAEMYPLNGNTDYASLKKRTKIQYDREFHMTRWEETLKKDRNLDGFTWTLDTPLNEEMDFRFAMFDADGGADDAIMFSKVTFEPSSQSTKTATAASFQTWQDIFKAIAECKQNGENAGEDGDCEWGQNAHLADYYRDFDTSDVKEECVITMQVRRSPIEQMNEVIVNIPSSV